MSEITGKTLIVTGASGGIGRVLALALAGQGVRLVLNARSHAALAKVAEECTKTGAAVDFLAGSAATSHVADGLVEKAIETGNFYGFIQAAG
ncbi:MAG: SDR family NAD(P)-dependent oxidoreductase, partial [Syntrophobacteraceae bacterium]